MARIPHSVLYYPDGDDSMVYEKTKYPYHFLEAHGVRVPQNLMRQARASAGLRVRRFAPTTWTPTEFLGSERVMLTHLEAPGYGADLMAYLLPSNQFQVNFKRSSYKPIDLTMIPYSSEAQSGV
jgi:hypothetical protein